jgi:DNA-binding beta-propeller fold protein YncE
VLLAQLGTYRYQDRQAPPVASPTSVSPPPATTFADLLGTIEGNPNRLSKPGGVAVDQAGNFYIADLGNNRVQKFDSDGHFLTMWGSPGSGPGQFSFRHMGLGGALYAGGVAVDAQGHVYVADSENQRIQKFDSSGQFLLQWGSQGYDPGQFLEPIDIEIDSQGIVYVLDHRGTPLQKFDQEGHFLLRWGHAVSSRYNVRGNAPGDIDDSGGIGLDPQGNIWVADYGNRRLQQFTAGGVFLSQQPVAGDGGNEMPLDVAMDRQGNLYVASESSSRVLKFVPGGGLRGVLTGTGADVGAFLSPQYVVIDAQGSLYVSDTLHDRVLKFRLR